jgi:hypothetical protein
MGEEEMRRAKNFLPQSAQRRARTFFGLEYERGGECVSNAFPDSRRRIGTMGLMILLFLLFTLSATAQLTIIHNSNGSVDWHFPTEAEAEAFKQKVLFQDKDLQTADSTIKYSLLPAIEKGKKTENSLDSALKECKRSGIEAHNTIGQLQGELIDIGTIRKPLIEWIGFYGGIGAGYVFADSVIGKETIINNLWNNLGVHGRAYVRIKDFMFTGELVKPFRSQFSINFSIGYRGF